MNTITITRKIKIAVLEEDKELKNQYYTTLRNWRNAVRKGANTIVAHKFCQQHIKDFVYLNEDAKTKFYVKDILCEGKGMSEQNTTYRVLSAILKPQGVPSEIYSCLNQSVANTFKKTYRDILVGKASLCSYRNNIPMPFAGKSLNFIWDKERKNYGFTLFGIPFTTILGRDRSNNKVMIERAIDGEYKICSSSIAHDDAKNQWYLYLCLQIPKQEHQLKEENVCYAILSIESPIVARVNDNSWLFKIGTAEEFLYRRRQIQEGLKRAQINAAYNVGGKGRKRKCQSIDRFKWKEQNYVATKMHEYSKRLVDYAIMNKCATIHLLSTKENSDLDKSDELLLRNWSYHGLIEKIKYKCNKAGITLIND